MNPSEMTPEEKPAPLAEASAEDPSPAEAPKRGRGRPRLGPRKKSEQLVTTVDPDTRKEYDLLWKDVKDCFPKDYETQADLIRDCLERGKRSLERQIKKIRDRLAKPMPP